MFYDEIKHYNWTDTTKCIASKSAKDVEIALGKEHLSIDDFMALISPAAVPYLEPMAQLSHQYTMERFGKTMSMYIMTLMWVESSLPEKRRYGKKVKQCMQ